jgi:acetyl-CoA acetyltransferase
MPVRNVAIAGVGTTPQGELPGRDAADIAVDAIELALADAGVTKDAIDGLITCRVGQSKAGVDTQVGARLGLNPRYSATLDYGTCNFSLHLAAMAIALGMASTVVIAYGCNQRTKKADFGFSYGGADLAAASGFLHISGAGALALRRHMHLYGTTEEQFGWIAVSQREWAVLNPAAVFRQPMSIDEYLAMPYMTEPLRRPDVTMISDGGAALVVTSADRASHLRPLPIHLLGMSQRTSLRDNQNPDNLMRPWLSDVARGVYSSAGMGPADVDIVYLQDPTAVWVLQMLEAYGFCRPGEAGPFLAEGHSRPGGSRPVNTNGGQLSESYMWGWLHLVEAVRQLRGQAGPRQVTGAETAMYCSTQVWLKGGASVISTHQ